MELKSKGLYHPLDLRDDGDKTLKIALDGTEKNRCGERNEVKAAPVYPGRGWGAERCQVQTERVQNDMGER